MVLLAELKQLPLDLEYHKTLVSPQEQINAASFIKRPSFVDFMFFVILIWFLHSTLV